MRDVLTQLAFRGALRGRGGRDLALMGSQACGWLVPRTKIDPSWTCYTAGIGEDASFDVALAEIGCEVVAIDPTPRAIEHMRPILVHHDNLKLAKYALWTQDTTLEFFPPANPDHVSHSLVNRQRTADPIAVDARTVATIAQEFGHPQVDLLKLDIEGAEYDVLQETDLSELGVRVLCVEFHDDAGLRAMIAAVRGVCNRGYNLASVRRTDVTFVRSS